jgi:hypothetical protein
MLIALNDTQHQLSNLHATLGNDPIDDRFHPPFAKLCTLDVVLCNRSSVLELCYWLASDWSWFSLERLSIGLTAELTAILFEDNERSLHNQVNTTPYTGRKIKELNLCGPDMAMELWDFLFKLLDITNLERMTLKGCYLDDVARDDSYITQNGTLQHLSVELYGRNDARSLLEACTNLTSLHLNWNNTEGVDDESEYYGEELAATLLKLASKLRTFSLHTSDIHTEFNDSWIFTAEQDMLINMSCINVRYLGRTICLRDLDPHVWGGPHSAFNEVLVS